MRKTLRWAAVGATAATAAAVLSVTSMAGASHDPESQADLADDRGVEVTHHGGLDGGHQRHPQDGAHGAGRRADLARHRGRSRGPAQDRAARRDRQEHRPCHLQVRAQGDCHLRTGLPGARGLAAAHSGRAVVRVNRIATKLAIATSASSIKAGSKATIAGTLTAGGKPLAGRADLPLQGGREGPPSGEGRPAARHREVHRHGDLHRRAADHHLLRAGLARRLAVRARRGAPPSRSP